METEAAEQATRSRFHTLVYREFGGDLDTVELALSRHPDRKVTRRTIHSWLAKSNAPSRRNCPAWAVEYLTRYLETNPNEVRSGKDPLARDQEQQTSQLNGSQGIYRSATSSLDAADHHCGRRKELEQRFRNASLLELPTLLAEMQLDFETKLASYFRYTQRVAEALFDGDESDTLEDRRRRFEQREMYEASESCIKYDAIRDISRGAEEFASDDGTLPKATT